MEGNKKEKKERVLFD